MAEEAKSVVACLLEKNGTYLVCRRPLHKRHGGLWEFPGGKIEKGESMLEAARRELAEELGLHVTACAGLQFSVFDHASGYLINFVSIEAEGEAKLLEHIELDWLPPSELAKLELAPSDRQFIEYFNSNIAGPS